MIQNNLWGPKTAWDVNWANLIWNLMGSILNIIHRLHAFVKSSTFRPLRALFWMNAAGRRNENGVRSHKNKARIDSEFNLYTLAYKLRTTVLSSQVFSKLWKISKASRDVRGLTKLIWDTFRKCQPSFDAPRNTKRFYSLGMSNTRTKAAQASVFKKRFQIYNATKFPFQSNKFFFPTRCTTRAFYRLPTDPNAWLVAFSSPITRHSMLCITQRIFL